MISTKKINTSTKSINKTKKNTKNNKTELNLSNIKDVYNDIIKNCSNNNFQFIPFLLYCGH